MKNIIKEIEHVINVWISRDDLEQDYIDFLYNACEMPTKYNITGIDLLDFALYFYDKHYKELTDMNDQEDITC